jgi:hypothetical protein
MWQMSHYGDSHVDSQPSRSCIALLLCWVVNARVVMSMPGKVKNCNWKGAIVTHCTLMKRCPWCENCLNKTLNPKAAIWNLEYHECCLVVKGIWLAIIYFYFQNKFVLTSSVFFWPNWGFSSSLQWWVLVLTWLAGWLADSVDNSNKPHVFYIAMDGTSPCSLVFTSRVCHEPKAY